jgi:hypothetical protein
MLALLLALGVDARPLERPPVVDGAVVADSEYFRPATLRWPKERGGMLVWVARHGDDLHVAALITDSTYYWGDDFVISLDPDGSGGAAPGAGDRQWTFRRDLDSSVVATAANGRWAWGPPLGTSHAGGDWSAASHSGDRSWSLEFRVRLRDWRVPRIAFRTFDDAPKGWWSWPAPRDGERATRVEMIPERWLPLRSPRGRSAP